LRLESSDAHDSEFLQIAMRILEEEREFLEQIGKL